MDHNCRLLASTQGTWNIKDDVFPIEGGFSAEKVIAKLEISLTTSSHEWGQKKEIIRGFTQLQKKVVLDYLDQMHSKLDATNVPLKVSDFAVVLGCGWYDLLSDSPATIDFLQREMRDLDVRSLFT
jgi:hypothetical protein